MRFKSLIFFYLITIVTVAKSQQIFRLSQYMQHNFIFNPAAAGAAEYSSIGIAYKKMWSGIEGGPQTTILYGDRYLASKQIGIAGFLYNDVTGPTARSGGEIALSYALPFGEKKRLQFGLSGNVIQERIDKAEIEKYIPDDPLLSGPGSWVAFDAAAGVYWTSPTINLGFSVKQLIQSKLDLIKTATSQQGRLYRQYYLMGNYRWKTDEENVIIPNFMFKFAENAPADFEVGAIIEHKSLIWLGFNAHYKQDFSAFAGYKINKKYSIGYAYDQYSTPLSIFDAGGNAHEISLKYIFR
jgi:type IX secretion system PorP/SprF family membrane protein